MTDANVLVDRVAISMFQSEDPKRTPLHWRRLPESKKDGYREKVEVVLLATMNAGFAIHEAGICKTGILLHGWTCTCGTFNGAERNWLVECRTCGKTAPGTHEAIADILQTIRR